ncbi:hypothetical protein Hanom_Chr01g00028831 [Helianthus anomalus]
MSTPLLFKLYHILPGHNKTHWENIVISELPRIYILFCRYSNLYSLHTFSFVNRS